MDNTRVEHIRAQAKGIMDSFFSALRDAKISTVRIGLVRKTQTRQPAATEQNDDFRQRMFKNAPNKDVDYIIAEKKQW